MHFHWTHLMRTTFNSFHSLHLYLRHQVCQTKNIQVRIARKVFQNTVFFINAKTLNFTSTFTVTLKKGCTNLNWIVGRNHYWD